ncbi:CLAVATA3/ESR-RELATED [Salix suchowensis]|nr:CLAVATA3/ESR-RELATED [Salix suchowensis]
MFMSRSQVGCLLLVLLSISAFHHGVVGARNLKENLKAMEETQNEKEGANTEDNNGYVANVNREVPSCPDPIHNR